MTREVFKSNLKEIELSEHLDALEFLDLSDKIYKTIKEIEDLGFRDVKVKFRSNIESYEEGILAYPTACFSGWREANHKEVKQLEREEKIAKIAKDKGITPYEATQYLNLLEKGVISDG